MNERKERQITISLSDSECNTLLNKCGEHGITINELFENFAGDLAGGSYTNGSDERMRAGKWFDRCWFGMFPEKTLLNHLLCNGYDPEQFYELIMELDSAIKLRTKQLQTSLQLDKNGLDKQTPNPYSSVQKEEQHCALIPGNSDTII